MLERLKRRFKQEKGFTLVELLAVIAILGIILAIAIPSIGNVIDNSKKDADQANVDLILNAARLAYLEEGQPDEGATYTVSDLNTKGYLAEVPTEPGNEESVYSGEVTVSKSGTKITYQFDGAAYPEDTDAEVGSASDDT
ncbi:hypothetical protein JNUCC1_00631 [Lentibacillus sp. JNUCC-1]|uniref:competence type IV pilus major pilin ComGC n=1 Tax=Lentibacillus sp. JNUCC-1 TaxID=2654513 RepID=UPI0012E7B13A|nr:prepilin-type N-terminal cleavage/methylation domain-containing protein [Lentibacillus sp. JNUCC-1]MUV36827.1 hypothetical protein [Lentibacillus sp. JNUCC-1]